MKPFPKISIITPTYNSQEMVKNFLQLISKQDYPKHLIEMLIIDGGSTDKTLEIVKKFKVKIINNPDKLAEPAITLGMSVATGDLMIVLAVDNFLTNKNSLKVIAGVFEDQNIYAAFPRHESTKNDTIYTKYINTFTDPYNHFVYGYAANARTFHKVYKTLEHYKNYDVYDYSSNHTQPMIALAQGFTIRKGFRRKKSQAFDDIQPVMDILRNKKKIAYIHSVPLYHHTVHSMDHFIRKQRWATRNALENRKYGVALRAKGLSAKQKMRMKLWPIYSLSFFIPFAVAIWGYIYEKKAIWLFHPFICFISAYASILEIIVYNTTSKAIVSRQK
jgi:glycosyltransferase involved in cell wall biosynthesis